MKTSLKNLHPFIGRHWRKGAVGVILIMVTSFLGIPQPLIMRYLVDDVILDHQLGLLAVTILLLAGILLAEKLTGLLQQFYFARFEQEVTLDIQQDLFNHVLRFPKAFFDEKQTGYLISLGCHPMSKDCAGFFQAPLSISSVTSCDLPAEWFCFSTWNGDLPLVSF